MSGQDMGSEENKEAAALHPERLTWAVLLGRWVEFAKSALALPGDAQGRRLRESVPDLILLQAVWFALQHMDELEADERALGLDRAQVLIEKHVAVLEGRWKGESLPEQIGELIGEARGQYERVRAEN